jgi:hypothetical protein
LKHKPMFRRSLQDCPNVAAVSRHNLRVTFGRWVSPKKGILTLYGICSVVGGIVAAH